jgi:RNA polymerase sigma factor (sigma-70 family)
MLLKSVTYEDFQQYLSDPNSPDASDFFTAIRKYAIKAFIRDICAASHNKSLVGEQDDFAQNVVMRVLRYSGSCKKEYGFWGWFVSVIVRYLPKYMLERRDAHKPHSVKVLSLSTDDPDKLGFMESEELPHDQQLENVDQVQYILSQLSLPSRDILVNTVMVGKTWSEYARESGKSRQAVHFAGHRALKEAREICTV